MKKLFLIAGFCVSLFAQANSQNYLEKAIRAIDVKAVEQIVAQEKFTQREYNRYVRLAEEMVRSREIWILKANYHDDVTTPSEKPSGLKLVLESYALSGMLFVGGVSADHASRTGDNNPLIITSFACAALFGKIIYDVYKAVIGDQEQKERLRKKYEDAVTIQQLIYAADVVEA